MAETKYGKYFISNPTPRLPDKPIAHHYAVHDKGSIEAPNRPGEGRFLTPETLPGSPVWLSIGRMMTIPDPQPFIEKHTHEADEILLWVSTEVDGELGAEVEISMGDEEEKHTFSKTTVVYIPKGLTHCPIYIRNKREDRHFYLITVLLKPEYD